MDYTFESAPRWRCQQLQFCRSKSTNTFITDKSSADSTTRCRDRDVLEWFGWSATLTE
jgi:hypothetical protein